MEQCELQKPISQLRAALKSQNPLFQKKWFCDVITLPLYWWSSVHPKPRPNRPRLGRRWAGPKMLIISKQFQLHFGKYWINMFVSSGRMTLEDPFEEKYWKVGQRTLVVFPIQARTYIQGSMTDVAEFWRGTNLGAKIFSPWKQKRYTKKRLAMSRRLNGTGNVECGRAPGTRLSSRKPVRVGSEVGWPSTRARLLVAGWISRTGGCRRLWTWNLQGKMARENNSYGREACRGQNPHGSIIIPMWWQEYPSFWLLARKTKRNYHDNHHSRPWKARLCLKYQTGSVRIRPEIELFKMADAEEIEVCKLSPRNTKQFLSRRRRPPLWAWFGHVKQSGKTRGSCWTWKRRSLCTKALHARSR